MLSYFFEKNCSHLFVLHPLISFHFSRKTVFGKITGLEEAFFFAGWWANGFVCGADLLGARCFLIIKGDGTAVGDLLEGVGDLFGGVGDLLGGGSGGGVAT